MEREYYNLYTQTNVDPEKERRALQELLIHLGQEAAQQQIERNCSSGHLDRLIRKSLEGAALHMDLPVEKLEKQCHEIAAAIGRRLPSNRFELVDLGERFRPHSCCAGMQKLLYGGLKGIAEFCSILSPEPACFPELTEYLRSTLAYLQLPGLPEREWMELVAECCRMCRYTQQLLETELRKRYGVPEPVRVRISPLAGKGILVLGMDLQVLAKLLELSNGQNIRIYTGGELLAAHAYPFFQQYPQLAGNYGSSGTKKQHKELLQFPGPVLVTSACFKNDFSEIADHCFSGGSVWSRGLTHLQDNELQTLIDKANEMPGFDFDESERFVMTGFGREALEKRVPEISSLLIEKKLKRICIVGGCDHENNESGYSPELVQLLPPDVLILTFGCGKYHFHRKSLGGIGSLPRLLDAGQCFDICGIMSFLRMLAASLEVQEEELPVTFFCNWNEQRTIPVLLTLLTGSFKEIFVHGSIPEDILESLQKFRNIRLTSSPQKDLASLDPELR